MGHHHEHHHHHHHVHAHGAVASEGMKRVLLFSILLNLLFVAIEAGVGVAERSLSLLSDAGHNLSDVFSLVLVLLAFRLAKVHATKDYTYGLKKSTVLISLLNAVLLGAAVLVIWWESLDKVIHPVAVNGEAMSWTAFAGILINGLTTWLLMRGQKDDINVRGAFLHMLADTLVSVGVVVIGVVIQLTGWYVVDPIVSLLITLVILDSMWGLLKESLKLALDGKPTGIDLMQVEMAIYETPGVESIHHVHVWAISTTENALTAHVVVNDVGTMEDVKHAVKHRLNELGIQHSTLEIELPGSHCHDEQCDGC